jgi:hypothetical protein
MGTYSTDKRMWTWVSGDGKHAAAGMGLGAGVGEKSGPGGSARHYSTANGQYVNEVAHVADSGSIDPDIDGISGGNEVRGKVLPPQNRPAHVVWKHPEEQQGLQPQMRDVVEGMRKVPEVDSLYISSGYRAPLTGRDPHADGRAVDVSRLNGYPVRDLETAEGPDANKARRAATNVEKWAREDDKVNQFIGPKGGWNRVGKRIEPISDPGLLKEHKDHFHINVFRN